MSNIIGSLLTATERHTESPESGAFQDSIEGSVRTRVVNKVVQCYKEETRTIIESLDTDPSELLTAGGRNPNGSPANYVNWGAGFEFQGADISEISPNFSRIVAKYKATDPAGAAGTPQSGATTGCIIGRPWEGGLRYIETPASGKISDKKIYLPDSLGWNQERQVDLNLICEKTDSRTVADGFSLAPAALTTNPYSGAKIEWGGGYALVSMYGTSLSPSFYAISAKYRKNRAWAIVHPPAGIVLACAAGVCSIVWNGIEFEEMDSLLATDITGLDVRIINGWTALMTCNGIPVADFTPETRTGDKVLEWVIAGNRAQLKFCGEIWKEYDA